MTDKEKPPTADDQNRSHNEAPSEGEAAESADSQRQHTQEAAEGDEPEK